MVWILIGILGAAALSGIALIRDEQISSLWFLTACICTQLIAYRFYSAFISAKILCLDANRITPAKRINDGKDFVPTNRWIVFGHHFAAIAGPGPLIGPTLAAQFGYLPGTLWILIGCVLAGAVQDLVILFSSLRRDGKSLGQMIKDEIGPTAGYAALIGTLAIIIILISVLALVVVKALMHSPWGSFTVFMTIPIAMLIGIYLYFIRPQGVLEASLGGLILFLLAVYGGKFVQEKFANKYYTEVTLGIDFTARDMQREQQKKGLPWEIAKAFDGSAAIGSFVALSETMQIGALSFRLDINGTTVQEGNTTDMIFSVDKVIAYSTQYFTINIGDMLFTGTPAGVGPVNKGDKLEGYLMGEKVLEVEVK